jgi:hypothetical protein
MYTYPGQNEVMALIPFVSRGFLRRRGFLCRISFEACCGLSTRMIQQVLNTCIVVSSLLSSLIHVAFSFPMRLLSHPWRCYTTLSVCTPYDSPSAYNAALCGHLPMVGLTLPTFTAAYWNAPLDYLHMVLQSQVLTTCFTLHHTCTRKFTEHTETRELDNTRFFRVMRKQL